MEFVQMRNTKWNEKKSLIGNNSSFLSDEGKISKLEDSCRNYPKIKHREKKDINEQSFCDLWYNVGVILLQK